MPVTAAYGAFASPISSDLVLSSAISLVDVLVTKDKTIVWVEGRPAEAGRNAIVSGTSGKEIEVIPVITKFNARTGIQEYGGGAVFIVEDAIIFSDLSTGAVYQTERDVDDGKWNKARQITPKSDVYRFGDFSAHPISPHFVASILEDHTKPAPADVVSTLVLINSKTSSLSTIASGRDFYSFPSFNADGSLISFRSHDHPEMPWTKSSLYVVEVTQSTSGLTFGTPLKIAGEGNESVSQPRWSLEGNVLVYLSDKSGYSELYRWSPDTGAAKPVLTTLTGADVGGPDWTLGNSTHGSLAPNTWISQAEKGHLRIIDLLTSTSITIPTPFRSIGTLRVVSPDSVVVIASSSTTPTVLAKLTISSDRKSVSTDIIKASSLAKVELGYISEAVAITFPTKKIGNESDAEAVAHGYYYPPVNQDFKGPEGELPPLILHCHGGPTSAAGSGFNFGIQYFTSRGFSYVDVNYGGSTGYGRNFRERLDTNWGIVDVNDTVACVDYLVSEGKVDPKRVAIVGGSAGGYTVLASLCASKVFTAGVSLYGVSDLALLAGDTHKFESQYLYGLLGGTPSEVPDNYRTRSPINNAQNITAPLLLLQGSIDKVVPPEQATKIADLIQDKSKVEVIIFEGEGHGFRSYDAKKRAMESELSHYRKTFGIKSDE